MIQGDQELASLILREEERQQTTLDLIASENIAPLGVREILGSVFMNKYSEGYPGRRYYPGNAVVDEVEKLAVKRASRAFGLGTQWHTYVQPYSGSPANIAVYLGLLEIGDRLMGMELSSGG